MTDQEHKIEIIKKHCIRISKEKNEEMTQEEVDALVEETDLMNLFMSCMDEWAGVISARIDESDNEEE